MSILTPPGLPGLELAGTVGCEQLDTHSWLCEKKVAFGGDLSHPARARGPTLGREQRTEIDGSWEAFRMMYWGLHFAAEGSVVDLPGEGRNVREARVNNEILSIFIDQFDKLHGFC